MIFFLRDDLFELGKFKRALSILRSVFANQTMLMSTNNLYHTMIGTILILEHACLFYASSSRPTPMGALVRACFQYYTSDVNSTITQFTAFLQEYSVSYFTRFILEHRI